MSPYSDPFKYPADKCLEITRLVFLRPDHALWADSFVKKKYGPKLWFSGDSTKMTSSLFCRMICTECPWKLFLSLIIACINRVEGSKLIEIYRRQLSRIKADCLGFQLKRKKNLVGHRTWYEPNRQFQFRPTNLINIPLLNWFRRLTFSVRFFVPGKSRKSVCCHSTLMLLEHVSLCTSKSGFQVLKTGTDLPPRKHKSPKLRPWKNRPW